MGKEGETVKYKYSVTQKDSLFIFARKNTVCHENRFNKIRYPNI